MTSALVTAGEPIELSRLAVSLVADRRGCLVMLLRLAYFTVTKRGDDIVTKGDALAERLELSGEIPDDSGHPVHYEVVKVPQGGALMVVAGLMSGLLGIGSGALKVMATPWSPP